MEDVVDNAPRDGLSRQDRLLLEENLGCHHIINDPVLQSTIVSMSSDEKDGYYIKPRFKKGGKHAPY